MKIAMELNKRSAEPLYRQIYSQIVKMLERGELKKGEILWPERMLSEALGVSRGTVNRTYAELKKHKLVVSKMGGHHYVLGLGDSDRDKRNEALEIIERMIDEILSLGFADNELAALINYKLFEREQKSEKIRMAIIECRKASLIIFERQLSYYKNVEISLFLMDELEQMKDRPESFDEFDFIITTATHYYDVCKILPPVKAKIIEAVISWDRKTIFELAAIGAGARIGVLYENTRTISLVEQALNYFQIVYQGLDGFYENDLTELEGFILSHDVIIAEPPSPLFHDSKAAALAERFREQGGQVICFDHYIEKGSILYIEELISALITKKYRNKTREIPLQILEEAPNEP